MRKKALFFSLICFIFLQVCAAPDMCFAFGDRDRGYVPQPVLISPVSEDAGISALEGIEFIWSPHEGDPIGRRGYDFRLYKGRDMVAGALVFKKMTGPRDSSILVGGDYFEAGTVYTWSLRMVYDNRAKSDRSYAGFRTAGSGK